MTDSALEELMFPKDKSATNKRMPNFDYIRKELLRNGVNKKLLWVEYCEECRMSSEEPLMYSQFCYYIQKDEEKRRATMHIPRKPGEQIEVDWAGDPAHIIDPDTGEITDAWIFVGVLTYSQYAFVKAYMNEKTDNWIKAHVQMFDFFGGVTPMLVSDNCTTAVNHKKSDWYNTALNTTYHEMAEHYNLAILPARVRKPKDKFESLGIVRDGSESTSAKNVYKKGYHVTEACVLTKSNYPVSIFPKYTPPQKRIINLQIPLPLMP